MKNLAIFLSLLLLGALLLFFIISKSAVAPTDDDDFPEGIPTNSAPVFARKACLDKVVGDNCTMLTGKETVTGICFASGSELACGPTEPDFRE